MLTPFTNNPKPIMPLVRQSIGIENPVPTPADNVIGEVNNSFYWHDSFNVIDDVAGIYHGKLRTSASIVIGAGKFKLFGFVVPDLMLDDRPYIYQCRASYFAKDPASALRASILPYRTNTTGKGSWSGAELDVFFEYSESHDIVNGYLIGSDEFSWFDAGVVDATDKYRGVALALFNVGDANDSLTGFGLEVTLWRYEAPAPHRNPLGR